MQKRSRLNKTRRQQVASHIEDKDGNLIRRIKERKRISFLGYNAWIPPYADSGIRQQEAVVDRSIGQSACYRVAKHI